MTHPSLIGALLIGCNPQISQEQPVSMPQGARVPVDAPVLFVGTVVSVGPAPGAWSGTLVMQQRVTYTVGRVLNGPVEPGQQVTVAHVLVAGSATADTDTPRLDPQLFAVGRELLVAATPGDPLTAIDETVGAQPLTEALRAALDAP